MGRPIGTVAEIIADLLGKEIPSAVNLPRPFLEEVARDILLSLQSDGLVVVPLRATDKMLDAVYDLAPPIGGSPVSMHDAWQALILASPHRVGDEEYWDYLLKMHSDDTDIETC